MEDVLSVYARPYNPLIPVICMDEKPVQMLAETRHGFRTSNGVMHYDNEYIRNGTASIFLFTEPLAGWRRAIAHERRTKNDWAEQIRELVDIDYPGADKIVLVMDNLNTHRISSLYEAFPPQKAFCIAQKLEIHYTPKHGSWLNIAECELSALGRQCLGKRRIPDLKTLNDELDSWYSDRNESQKSIDWQFSVDDARIKLKRLYPIVEF